MRTVFNRLSMSQRETNTSIDAGNAHIEIRGPVYYRTTRSDSKKKKQNSPKPTTVFLLGYYQQCIGTIGVITCKVEWMQLLSNPKAPINNTQKA